MNQEDKKLIISKLTQEQQKVATYIEELEEQTQPISPDSSIGRLSRMDAINNKSVSEAALRKAKEKLLKIKHTLETADDPDFGNCRNCGEPIPVGRLVVMPGSSLCVKCAQRS
ncbi:MAG: TraR/DksA C4-type zinc finger protein [Bacteroidales bacterium]